MNHVQINCILIFPVDKVSASFNSNVYAYAYVAKLNESNCPQGNTHID